MSDYYPRYDLMEAAASRQAARETGEPLFAQNDFEHWLVMDDPEPDQSRDDTLEL